MNSSATQSQQSSSSSSSTAAFPPSSSSSFDLGKLQAELECCICMCLYEEPKQLPCGHICCGGCVQSLIDMANEPTAVGILFGGRSPHKTIACPQCRKDCQVPTGGFTTAFTVQNLVSRVKEAEEIQSLAAMKAMMLCSNCSACDKRVPNQDMFYCISCHDFDDAEINEDNREELNARLMKKLICALCGCKLHTEHRLVPADAAYEAVVTENKKKLDEEKAANQQRTKCLEEAMKNQLKSAEMSKVMSGKEEEEDHGHEEENNKRKAADLAEQYRLKGNEAFGRCIFEDAIKQYTLSIRQLPSSVCLSNRAQANLKLGRYSVAYVDANEALRLDPNNKKAKMRRDTALEGMGMAQQQKEGSKVNAKVKGPAAAQSKWAKNLQISAMYLANEQFVDDEMAAFVPQNMVCILSTGKPVSPPVPLRQLDTFLNQQDVQGAVPQIIFKFFKFDDAIIQMFRRINRKRFRRVETGGIRFKGYQWLNCDFSKCSESSFRWLLDELIETSTFCITEWTGMPAGYNYNTLFKLKAFRDAMEVKYDFGELHAPDSPEFNMHLETDVLIDFLFSPGFRSLHVIDGQLHDDFDTFLDRLIERYNQDDQQNRFFELVVLVLNPTARLKRRMRKPLISMHHPITGDRLVFEMSKPADVRIPIGGSYKLTNFRQLQVRRIRGREDLNTILHYHSQQDGGPMMAYSES